MKLEFSEGMNQIPILENHIKLLADHSFAVYKCYTDLLAIAVTDRALKLSRGFRCLIESKNIQCAVAIARCQIDNLARLYGVNLVPQNERNYVYTILDPKKKLSKIKDSKDKQLTDQYLVGKLDENYPTQGIKKIYDEFCKYVHLSEMHHRSCSQISKHSDGYIEFTSCISADDIILDDISYNRVLNVFFIINKTMKEELTSYFLKRKNFPNNNLN